MDGHAVSIRARFKLIAQTQLEIALVPEIRVIQFADFFRAFFNQHTFFKVEQIRRLAADFFPPTIKVAGGNNVMANTLVIKLKQGIVIHQDIAAARFVLKFLDFRTQF
nr:Uncharacterised protein [Salmonella enterica subsp. enterica serovar Typhi]